MHTTYAIEVVRQNSERAQRRAERTGPHLAVALAACSRARGLAGLIGGCARA